MNRINWSSCSKLFLIRSIRRGKERKEGREIVIVDNWLIKFSIKYRSKFANPRDISRHYDSILREQAFQRASGCLSSSRFFLTLRFLISWARSRDYDSDIKRVGIRLTELRTFYCYRIKILFIFVKQEEGCFS